MKADSIGARTYAMDRQSLKELEAAAEIPDSAGRLYRWLSQSPPTYEVLDPIEKCEFDSLVEELLMASNRVWAER